MDRRTAWCTLAVVDQQPSIACMAIDLLVSSPMMSLSVGCRRDRCLLSGYAYSPATTARTNTAPPSRPNERETQSLDPLDIPTSTYNPTT